MREVARRGFLRCLGWGGAGLWATARLGGLARAAGAGGAAGPEKPNFVFFLIDDMGWMDLSCQGSRFYETPNIDALAAAGMRFTSAYAACPVCSPTRASIMTGKYPARVNITNFIPGNRPGKLLGPEYLHAMPLEEVTVAEALKEAGYATGFLGKWHLGGEGFLPTQQGFDKNVGGNQRGGPASYFAPYKNPDIPDGPAGEYITDRLGEEAAKFIETNKDKPFLVYLSHYAVHIPLQAKKDLAAKYQEKAGKLPEPAGPKFLPEGKNQARQVQDHAVYAAMVQSTDESVGRVMRALKDAGVAGRTVVFFMSDNGGLSTAEGSPTSNVPLRGGKGWLYEGGVREPMIIAWPGVAKAGSTCDEPVTSTDFYPTMLEMAGLPARPPQHCDGVSLVPLLKQTGRPDRKAIFWHYPHYSNQGGTPGGAIRSGDWKLIEFYEDSRVELYSLKDDIGEKNDLAAKMPEKAAELRKMLQDWRQSVGAKMPTPNPNWDPNRPAGSQPAKAGKRKAAAKGAKQPG